MTRLQMGRIGAAVAMTAALAAGAWGAVGVSVAGAASGGWVATEAPLPGDASSANPLVDVTGTSCVSTTVCTAVGRYTDSDGHVRPLIETWSGGAWTDQQAPQPATASTDTDGHEDATLNAISCTAVGTCVAVGTYNQYDTPDHDGWQFGLIDTESGGVWSAQVASQPSSGGMTQTAVLNSVSCVAAGTCVAVGHYVDFATSNTDGLVETRVSGTWHTSFANLPTGVLTANGPTSLTAVSCPAEGDCVAVGSYTDNTDHINGLIERLYTGAWTPTGLRADEPATAGTDGDSRQNVALGDVSCSAITFCSAVGSYDDTSGFQHALDDTLFLGTWFTVYAAEPVGSGTDHGTTQYAGFAAASCGASEACVAVGAVQDDRGLLHPLVNSYNGTVTLSLATVTEPSNQSSETHQYARLYATACTSATSCVAVGNYEDSAVHQQGLIETLASGTWTPDESPLPSAAANPEVAQYGVSCSATTCAAVGTYLDGSSHTQGLLEIYTPPHTTGGGGGGGGGGASAPLPTSGYDLVGSDGGVFVFPTGQAGGFYGSLPGLHVSVNNIVGIVPSSDYQGYFLVGSDGGVFSFGDTTFEGSLPGINVHVSNIVGIVPTSDDKGYFLVGSDGGVFTFGDAHFLGSLPGLGVSVHDVIGIAATPGGAGYWVVEADGVVTHFGNAPGLGNASAAGSPLTAIASTPDGGGYWVASQNGNVQAFGDAVGHGSLPALGVTPALPVIGIVPTASGGGYWLIGSDGGVFAFGDASEIGSLPGLTVHVGDVVGAVPTVG